LKLSTLRVVECAQCVQNGEKILQLCGYQVPTTLSHSVTRWLTLYSSC